MQTLVSLGAGERSAITEHLLGLGDDDRCDRFMAAANDAAMADYVQGIGFARDILIGARGAGPGGTRLLGLAHASIGLEHGEVVGEVGISVDRSERRQGLGRELFMAVMAAARRCGVTRVEVIFRSANAGMAGLTRALGGVVVRDGAESRAAFAIHPPRRLPLRSSRSALGFERISARHPRELGRALLVHGAGGDSYPWLSRVVPALWKAGYSLLAPTLPGHGRRPVPEAARLDDLQACVDEAANDLAPTLLVGHGLGGYLLQRYLQARPVERTVLLASLPANPPRGDDLDRTLDRMPCPLARESARIALTDAPALGPLSLRDLALNNVQVFGGRSDAWVPEHWVHQTAARYGVHPQFLAGGHRLMIGRAADQLLGLLAA
jgi:GNAT superfamily N-acetyltransferase